MEHYFISLPKIELHAHLSGSISMNTLRDILNYDDSTCDQLNIPDAIDYSGDIDGCFHLFSLIHDQIKTPDALKRATSSVIEDFSSDGVVYLELRSTPRPLPTPDLHVEAVLHGIFDAPSVCSNRIDVRLLLSIDRARGVEAARSTVELLLEYGQRFPKHIVGIDVSGNPSCGSLLDYAPLLDMVRQHGFRTTVHLAEVPGQDNDWLTFLDRHIPDRIGHGTFLPVPGSIIQSMESQRATELVRKYRVPIEACLTSNVKSGTVADYPSHHVISWLAHEHPVCICTDDKAIFGCSASGELSHLVERCGIKKEQLCRILSDSAEAAFCCEYTKRVLVNRMKSFFASTLINLDDCIC